MLIVFSVWFTKDLVLDLLTGTEQVQLHNVDVTKLHGSMGLTSLHYYLEGVDAQGERYKIEINSSDYSKVSASDTLTIRYYRHTRRLYDFGGRDE